ncbi:MAG: hypothetical protein OHK0017_01770 [Patescibacteria group bacterium]
MTVDNNSPLSIEACANPEIKMLNKLRYFTLTTTTLVKYMGNYLNPDYKLAQKINAEDAEQFYRKTLNLFISQSKDVYGDLGKIIFEQLKGISNNQTFTKDDLSDNLKLLEDMMHLSTNFSFLLSEGNLIKNQRLNIEDIKLNHLLEHLNSLLVELDKIREYLTFSAKSN